MQFGPDVTEDFCSRNSLSQCVGVQGVVGVGLLFCGLFHLTASLGYPLYCIGYPLYCEGYPLYCIGYPLYCEGYPLYHVSYPPCCVRYPLYFSLDYSHPIPMYVYNASYMYNIYYTGTTDSVFIIEMSLWRCSSDLQHSHSLVLQTSSFAVMKSRTKAMKWLMVESVSPSFPLLTTGERRGGHRC